MSKLMTKSKFILSLKLFSELVLLLLLLLILCFLFLETDCENVFLKVYNYNS